MDLLCCSVSLHLKGTWETQNHQAFCVSLVLVSFTLIYRAACPLLVKHSTINLSLTSEESLTDSSYQILGTVTKYTDPPQKVPPILLLYGEQIFQNFWTPLQTVLRLRLGLGLELGLRLGLGLMLGLGLEIGLGQGLQSLG